MDANTRRTLNRISRGVPAHLARNTVKTTVDTSQEEIAREALKRDDLTAFEKDNIRKLIEKGAFRTVETGVNEEVVKEIDRYNTRAVEAARRRGELKDPNDDPFIRRRNARLRARQS